MQMAEYRISIYGRKQSEWDQLASWIVNNELYSDNVVWLIQVFARNSTIRKIFFYRFFLLLSLFRAAYLFIVKLKKIVLLEGKVIFFLQFLFLSSYVFWDVTLIFGTTYTSLKVLLVLCGI